MTKPPNLPTEIWAHIARNLPQQDLAALAATSTQLRTAAQNVQNARDADLKRCRNLLRGSAQIPKTTGNIIGQIEKIEKTDLQKLRKHKADPAWKSANQKFIADVAGRLKQLVASFNAVVDATDGTIAQLLSAADAYKTEIARLRAQANGPDETDEDMAEKAKNVAECFTCLDETNKIVTQIVNLNKKLRKSITALLLEFYGSTSVRVPGPATS